MGKPLFLMRLQCDKRSAVKLVSRIIPRNGVMRLKFQKCSELKSVSRINETQILQTRLQCSNNDS